MSSTERALTAARVEEVFVDCLFKDGEATDDMVRVEGIVNQFGFHPGRLSEHSAEIGRMLDELPDPFQPKDGRDGRVGGDGWSFLNACDNRWGEQWTGLHQTMDRLFALGQATGRVVCQLPRDMWAMLPGGMPYYSVIDAESAS